MTDTFNQILTQLISDETGKVLPLLERVIIGDAVQKAEKILTILKKVQSADQASLDTEYLISLNNLAELYRAQGRYADAEPLYLEALEIKRTALGAAHPDTATSLNNLAQLYRAQGRYADAEPLYHEALEIFRTALGAAHPDTATSLNNLAALYHAQGRYTDAEPLYLEALEIRRTALGAAHPDTATSLNNLAQLYRAQGRYADAEPLYLEALEIRRTALGAAHPDTLLIQMNLGMFLDQLDRSREADGYLTGLRDRFLKVLPADHPWIANLDAHMAARDAPRADPNTFA